MAQFGSNGQSNLGSLGIRPFFNLAPLPTIVAEWTSLIPLVCHLASHQDSHRLAGELAIRGGLYISLFPKLGVLDNIARLIRDRILVETKMGNGMKTFQYRTICY